MRFPRFGHHNEPGDPAPRKEPFGTWHDSDVADEVEAVMEGRAAYYYAATHGRASAWVALNRLAHARMPELVRLVAGTVRASSVPSWATTERFLAGRILAQAPTPSLLDELQSQVLIPLELDLMGRCRTQDLGAEQVLEEATQALDTFAS
jgi:hypothetical protein